MRQLGTSEIKDNAGKANSNVVLCFSVTSTNNAKSPNPVGEDESSVMLLSQTGISLRYSKITHAIPSHRTQNKKHPRHRRALKRIGPEVLKLHYILRS